MSFGMKAGWLPALASRRPRKPVAHRRPSRRLGLLPDLLESRSLLTITGATGLTLSPNPVAGTSFTTSVATFTTTPGDTGPFSATINWGDGYTSVSTNITGSSPSYTVNGTHTYLAATPPGLPDVLTVTITDASDNSNGTATSTAVVNDAPITISPLTITEPRGTAFSTDVATFTSGNPFAAASSFTATINWGDGSSNTAGTVTEDANHVYHVAGAHTYATSGTFPITVSVLSSGGSTATTSPTSTADVVASTISAQGLPITVAEGVALSNQPVAAFSDASGLPTTDYSATIAWGDGVSSAGQIVSVGGDNYQVLGGHTYTAAGSYIVSVAIDTSGSPSAVANTQATVTPVAATASPANFTTPERTTYSGLVASFTSPTGTTPEPASSYSATISWGDGTPPTEGTVSEFAPGSYVVDGIHTYADAGTTTSNVFPVTVTINDLTDHTSSQVVSDATVTDIPITLTAQLNPATDTGVSAYDAITRDVQPSFFGSSEADSTVTITAQPTAGGATYTLGQTTADASGDWSITSNVALPDGTYTVTAHAVDPAGVTTASVQVLPNSIQGPLTIDTHGPKITSVQFNPLLGQFAVTIQPGIAGLDLRTALDGANYIFSFNKFSRSRPGPRGAFLVTGLSVAGTPGTGTTPTTVDVTINRGRILRGGLYKLTILDGIEDNAGNPLDGEFYGYFPSGNNGSGSDFVARFNFIHGHGSRPLPVTSSASPNSPPGTLGPPFYVSPIDVASHKRADRDSGKTTAASRPDPREATRSRVSVHPDPASAAAARDASRRAAIGRLRLDHDYGLDG